MSNVRLFFELFVFEKTIKTWEEIILVIYGCAYILLKYYVAIVMQIIQMSVVHNLYNDVYCCGLFNDVLWITQVSAINEYAH